MDSSTLPYRIVITMEIISDTKEKMSKFNPSETRHMKKLCNDGMCMQSEKNAKKVNAGIKYVNSGIDTLIT